MTGGNQLDPDRATELVARANDPIVLLDAGATIEWANDAVRQLGWEPSQLVGRSALELIEPVDLERALLALVAIDQGHTPPSSAPFEIRSADGGLVECDIAAWVLGDPAEPEAIVVHARPTQDSRVLRNLLERLLAGDGAAVVVEDMLRLLYHRNPYVRPLVTFVDEDGESRVIAGDLDPRLAGLGHAADSPWERARHDGDELVIEGPSGLAPDVSALADQAGLRDCWIVPVRSDDHHLATITLWVGEGGPPVQLDTYSVRLLSQLIQLVLRWRRQTRDLERAATRDPLTGLPNRRAIAEFDAEGPRRNIGVLCIDLDRFKPVNDRLGHAAGDQVLRTVANRLQSAVRPTDIVARLGGDEFGIICPGCSTEELALIADRVHALLSEAIGVHAQVVTIGSSIGVAAGHDRAGPLLDQADRALYDAKQAGRGRISWATSHA